MTAANAMSARGSKHSEPQPPPQAFVLTGRLDRVRRAGGRFRLRLRDGRFLPGRLDPEEIAVEALCRFRRCEVSVTGMVHFRRDGTPRRIVARHLTAHTEVDDIFEPLPRSAAPGAPVMPSEVEKKQMREFDWDRIEGAWPGEETIEELLDQLAEIRGR